jgi:hypothetical protein
MGDQSGAEQNDDNKYLCLELDSNPRSQYQSGQDITLLFDAEILSYSQRR